MITKIGNYEVELSGSLIMVRKNDELVKATDVNPLDAVDTYYKLVKKIEAVHIQLLENVQSVVKS